MSGPFEAGERVAARRPAGPQYLFVLQDGGDVALAPGTLAHDLLIGRPEGTRVRRPAGWSSRPSGPGSPTSR